MQDIIISDESLNNPNTYDVFLELFDDTACIDQKEQLLLTTENVIENTLLLLLHVSNELLLLLLLN